MALNCQPTLVIVFAIRTPFNPLNLLVYPEMPVRIIGAIARLTLGANPLTLLRLGTLDRWQVLRHITYVREVIKDAICCSSYCGGLLKFSCTDMIAVGGHKFTFR